MEASAVRSDPAADNMPKAMTGKGPQKLAYLAIMAVGLVLIAFGSYAFAESTGHWVGHLCVASGVAICAPGLLSYLYRRYLLEDITGELRKPAEDFKEQALTKIDEATSVVFDKLLSKCQMLLGRYEGAIELLRTVQSAGIYRVYANRRDAFAGFLEFITEEPREIVVVGSSLRGLLQEQDSEYEQLRGLLMQRRDSKVKLRFVLTHPKVADLRAQQEGRRQKDIGQEIMKSLRILIDEWKIPRDDIKLYQGTPTCFGVKTGKAMLLNTYPYGKEAYQSPCLIVLKGEGYFYNAFDDSHFKAWGSVAAQELPANLLALEERLDEYASRVEGLMRPGPATIVA